MRRSGKEFALPIPEDTAAAAHRVAFRLALLSALPPGVTGPDAVPFLEVARDRLLLALKQGRSRPEDRVPLATALRHACEILVAEMSGLN